MTKIELLSTHNLICRKFAQTVGTLSEILRCLSENCNFLPAHTFVTHDAAGRAGYTGYSRVLRLRLLYMGLHKTNRLALLCIQYLRHYRERGCYVLEPFREGSVSVTCQRCLALRNQLA